MSLIFKYLLITALISLSVYAKGEECELDFSEKLRLDVTNSLIVQKSKNDFDSEINYEKLTSAHYDSYIDFSQAVYTFVDEHPEDIYSVDLLKLASEFYWLMGNKVNIPLFRKITKIASHPKIYDVHMVLYFYGEEADKGFAMWNFSIIAGDKTHPRQKDAKEFLDAIGKDWDKD